jgi:hypothetical protein
MNPVKNFHQERFIFLYAYLSNSTDPFKNDFGSFINGFKNFVGRQENLNFNSLKSSSGAVSAEF